MFMGDELVQEVREDFYGDVMRFFFGEEEFDCVKKGERLVWLQKQVGVGYLGLESDIEDIGYDGEI